VIADCPQNNAIHQTLRIWDVGTGRSLLPPLAHQFYPQNDLDIRSYGGEYLDGHVMAVNSVAWSLDGRRIVSGSDDCTLRLWNPVTGRTVGKSFSRCHNALWDDDTPRQYGGMIKTVAFGPDGRKVISGSSNKI
jgi:WD40 repeat protein